MKFAIVALCIIGCALAAPPSESGAQVLRSEYDITPEGSFQKSFETDNGISSQSTGVVRKLNDKESVVEITGSEQYTSPDGQIIRLIYTADENGFRPQGDHLPTPPAPEPLPESVVRTLAYIAAHPYVEKKN